ASRRSKSSRTRISGRRRFAASRWRTSRPSWSTIATAATFTWRGWRNMPADNGYQHDILVIGGGGAGLRAAIAAVEESSRLSVAVLSKVYPMRSHTVSAEGGMAAVMRDNDSLDTHAKDTIFGSDFLA